MRTREEGGKRHTGTDHMASSPTGPQSLRPNTCLLKHTHTKQTSVFLHHTALLCSFGFSILTHSCTVPHWCSRGLVCQGPGPSGHKNTHIRTDSCLLSLTVPAPSSWHSPVCACKTLGTALGTLQGTRGTQSVRGLFLKDTRMHANTCQGDVIV